MTTIFIKATDQELSAAVFPTIAQNGYNSAQIMVEFDSTWDGYAKTAIFRTTKNSKPYEVVLSSENTCQVPPEVLVEEGHLLITLKGEKVTPHSIKPSTTLKLKISGGSPLILHADPTKNIYSQILSTIWNANTDIAELKARLGTLLSGVAPCALDGEGNNIEVVDMRVNYDGNSFNTAGDAVRTEQKKAAKSLEKLSKNKFTFDEYEFENGSWNANDVTSNGEVYRVRTKGVLYFPFAVRIFIKAGFKVRGYLCNEQNVSVSTLNWFNTYYDIPAFQRIRLVIAREIEDTTETADIAEFISKIEIKTDNAMLFESLDEGFASLKAPMTYPKETFTRGTIEGWKAGAFNPAMEYRVTSDVTFKHVHDVRITANDGYQVMCVLFEDGVLKSDGEWLSYVDMPAGQEYKIVIRKSPEDTTITADIDTFLSAVSYVSQAYLRKEYSEELTEEMDFALGTLSSGAPTDHNGRLYTKNIHFYHFPVVLKHNANYRMAVHTYDETGAFKADLGWVTQTADYTIPPNTYFRLIVTTMSYDDELPLTEVNVYDTGMYKSIDVRVDGIKIGAKVDRAVNDNDKRFKKALPVVKKVHSINHRGYNYEAPENTLPAYKLSKKNGFDFVECDIRWTSDGVPVLMHDVTINRTGRNADGTAIAAAVNIADITYEEALTYDFGVYFSEQYAGTKIPTFDEFIQLCRNIGLHPYVEIEDAITAWQAKALVEIVKKHGMNDGVTWISFSDTALYAMFEADKSARLGVLCITATDLPAHYITRAKTLQMQGANVFLNIDMNAVEACVEVAKKHNLPVEVWCPNTVELIVGLPSYVTGVTTDKLIAHKVLLDHYLGD